VIAKLGRAAEELRAEVAELRRRLGRYQNYFHPGWEHIAGNQACLAHVIRDYEDAAECWPGAVCPVQAQRACIPA
jgi:hypothetical protein